MPVLHDLDEVAAYMAVRFKGVDSAGGWLSTTVDVENAMLPVAPIGGSADADQQALLGPPDRSSYAEVRQFSNKITRQYEGSFSSGGPLTAHRAGHADLVIVRETDSISPYLFEYCCTGKTLAVVHLVRVHTDAVRAHVVLQDVQVTSFDYEAKRVLRDDRNRGVVRNGVTGDEWTESTRLIRHLDRLTLRYETRSVTLRTGTLDTTRGWETVQEQPVA